MAADLAGPVALVNFVALILVTIGLCKLYDIVRGKKPRAGRNAFVLGWVFVAYILLAVEINLGSPLMENAKAVFVLFCVVGAIISFIVSRTSKSRERHTQSQPAEETGEPRDTGSTAAAPVTTPFDRREELSGSVGALKSPSPTYPVPSGFANGHRRLHPNERVFHPNEGEGIVIGPGTDRHFVRVRFDNNTEKTMETFGLYAKI